MGEIRPTPGNPGVELDEVSGSAIYVTYDGKRRLVPLEPAATPVDGYGAPSRLVHARARVVPYADRAGLLVGLHGWLAAPEGFSGWVIVGPSGAGKTRVGVELCEAAGRIGWLAGLLARRIDPAALEELVGVPTPRLVVVDCADSRAEQLEVVLPALAARATPAHPVRVLLLVRAGAGHSADWTEAQGRRGGVLAGAETRVLDQPLTAGERQHLFRAAVGAFATHPMTLPPDGLDAPVFAGPLPVVISAYLAARESRPTYRPASTSCSRALPGTRTATGWLSIRMWAPTAPCAAG